jgi:hypothetical protein
MDPQYCNENISTLQEVSLKFTSLETVTSSILLEYHLHDSILSIVLYYTRSTATLYSWGQNRPCRTDSLDLP